MSKTSAAWNILFKQEDIIREVESRGFFKISASRINKQREARLMAKFDHASQLPKIFRDNGLSIQPTARGEYIIGKFESYFTLPDLSNSEVQYRELNPNISTLDAASIYSESSALLCAYHSGMIDEVLDESALFTTFGRMSTGSFSYSIRSSNSALLQHPVNVEKSQCEIDGGFEGATKYGLLEVKTGSKDDFIIRQLFYPYRLWTARTSKEVVPIFLTVSNDIFSFYIFKFADNNVYNSLELVQSQRFCISKPDITVEDIRDILEKTKEGSENKDIVFPQADSFPRVIDLLGKMNASQESIDKEALTTEYAFDSRQTDYYLNASLYIGLIQREENRQYSLNKIGIEIMSSHPRKRYLSLVERILLQPIFNSALRMYFRLGYEPAREDIVRVIIEIRPDVSTRVRGWQQSTVNRRAQTVLAWLRWIMELTNPIN